jgi:hypothetical protein
MTDETYRIVAEASPVRLARSNTADATFLSLSGRARRARDQLRQHNGSGLGFAAATGMPTRPFVLTICLTIATSCSGSPVSLKDAARDSANAEVKSDIGGLRGSVPDAPNDRTCPGAQVLVYNSPGCGAFTPPPVCAGPAFDACFLAACGCNGQLVGGCGYYAEPFAHLGPCEDGGALDTVSSDPGRRDEGADQTTTTDAIEWDAALQCNGMSCAAGELCLRSVGGIDGGPVSFRCEPVPADCGANPTCDCIKMFVFGCRSFQCRSEGPRRFACGEGA